MLASSFAVYASLGRFYSQKRKYSVETMHCSFLHEQDKQSMIDLAGQFQTDHLHVVDQPYRLSSWGLDDTENVRWL